MLKLYSKQVAQMNLFIISQRIMISSTDLLAENYFISLLGGDNDEKSL